MKKKISVFIVLVFCMCTIACKKEPDIPVEETEVIDESVVVEDAEEVVEPEGIDLSISGINFTIDTQDNISKIVEGITVEVFEEGEAIIKGDNCVFILSPNTKVQFGDLTEAVNMVLEQGEISTATETTEVYIQYKDQVNYANQAVFVVKNNHLSVFHGNVEQSYAAEDTSFLVEAGKRLTDGEIKDVDYARYSYDRLQSLTQYSDNQFWIEPLKEASKTNEANMDSSTEKDALAAEMKKLREEYDYWGDLDDADLQRLIAYEKEAAAKAEAERIAAERAAAEAEAARIAAEAAAQAEADHIAAEQAVVVEPQPQQSGSWQDEMRAELRALGWTKRAAADGAITITGEDIDRYHAIIHKYYQSYPRAEVNAISDEIMN